MNAHIDIVEGKFHKTSFENFILTYMIKKDIEDICLNTIGTLDTNYRAIPLPYIGAFDENYKIIDEVRTSIRKRLNCTPNLSEITSLEYDSFSLSQDKSKRKKIGNIGIPIYGKDSTTVIITLSRYVDTNEHLSAAAFLFEYNLQQRTWEEIDIVRMKPSKREEEPLIPIKDLENLREELEEKVKGVPPQKPTD